MNGFKEAPRSLSHAEGGNHADGTGNLAGLVREDVAEEVFCHNHVKLAGIPDHLHSGVVHIHMQQFHIRTLFRHFRDDFPPQPGGVQHVGLVHGRDAVAARARHLKRHMGQTADFVFRVGHNVRRFLFAVHFLRGVIAKVDAAGQFPDHHKVNALIRNVFAQGTGGGQRRKYPCRADIGVQPHSLAQHQQSPFRTVGGRLVVPLRAAYRAQQHTVRAQAGLQTLFRQGNAEQINRVAAHRRVHIGERMAEFGGHGVQHAQRFRHDFRPDAVAFDHGNGFPLAPRFQRGHQAAVRDHLFDKGREGFRLEFLPRGLVRNHACVEIHADAVPVFNRGAGGGTLQNGKADVNGVAVENAGETGGNHAGDAGRLDRDRRVFAGGAAAKVYPGDHDVARMNLVHKLLVNILHTVGGQFFRVLGSQIAGGDDDVRIDVVSVFVYRSLCVHYLITSVMFRNP